jgi:hypothetical protein
MTIFDVCLFMLRLIALSAAFDGKSKPFIDNSPVQP